MKTQAKDACIYDKGSTRKRRIRGSPSNDAVIQDL